MEYKVKDKMRTETIKSKERGVNSVIRRRRKTTTKTR